ncbi:MAG: hypothetical protein KDA93_01890 [Planctomycetaceae bacterium]|nr:hypothetical protein [Planctomycetaceae bacterium]
MAKAVSQMSVAELEKALSAKREKVDALLTERDQILRELDKVEGKIRDLGGNLSGRRAQGRRGPRAKNEKPLWGYVEDILGRSKRGVTIEELEKKVLASGYKTNSNNFRNVIYQCLYHAEQVSHDSSTGRYVLEG